jgi:hypothetical protein
MLCSPATDTDDELDESFCLSVGVASGGAGPGHLGIMAVSAEAGAGHGENSRRVSWRATGSGLASLAKGVGD